MRRIFIRLMLASTAVLLTAIWADQLLYVGQRQTETVVTAEELEQLLAAIPTDAVEETKTKEPDPAANASEVAEEHPTDTAAASTSSADENVSPPTQTLATEPPPGDRQSADRPAPTSQASSPPATSRDSNVTPLVAAGSIALASQAQAGGLVSFVGGAATSESAPADVAGSSPGLVCDVSFEAIPNWQRLHQVQGVLPAVVRARPGYVELAVLTRGVVGQPVTIAAFLADHPGYAGQRAVLLPNSWLLDVADQLLPYKSGWQPHLLIDDATFAAWTTSAEEFAQSQGHPLPSVARLKAVATLRRTEGRCDVHLTFQHLELKAVSP